jgi:hypothetical protein
MTRRPSAVRGETCKSGSLGLLRHSAKMAKRSLFAKTGKSMVVPAGDYFMPDSVHSSTACAESSANGRSCAV